MPDFEDLATFGGYNEYSNIALKKHTTEELRDEYRAFRKEARARVKELRSSDFSDGKMVHGKGYLRTNPDKMNRDELMKALTDSAKFIWSRLSTVEGQEQMRERTLEKFELRGYGDVINEETYAQFGKYMDEMGGYITSKIIGSPEAVDMFAWAKENHISLANITRNFEFYNENMEKISKLNLNPSNVRPYTARDLKRMLAAQENRERKEVARADRSQKSKSRRK